MRIEKSSNDPFRHCQPFVGQTDKNRPQGQVSDMRRKKGGAEGRIELPTP